MMYHFSPNLFQYFSSNTFLAMSFSCCPYLCSLSVPFQFCDSCHYNWVLIVSSLFHSDAVADRHNARRGGALSANQQPASSPISIELAASTLIGGPSSRNAVYALPKVLPIKPVVSLKILIVEDSLSITKVVCQMLKQKGYYPDLSLLHLFCCQNVGITFQNEK